MLHWVNGGGSLLMIQIVNGMFRYKISINVIILWKHAKELFYH